MRPGLLTTVAWGIEDATDYALEASVFVTGAAVQWLRDGLGILSEPGETEAHGPQPSTPTTASTSCLP